MVENVARNMHPVYHKERREARVKALCKAYSKDSSTRYVDAARYAARTKWAYAVSVTSSKGADLCSATVNADDTDSAEETAVVLPTVTVPDTQGRVTVITDSQAA